MQIVNAMLETFGEKLLARTNERAQEFQTKTGVRVGVETGIPHHNDIAGGENFARYYSSHHTD